MLNPYLGVIFAAIIWGSAGVFIKYLNLPPATITFFRVFIPTIMLLLFFIARKQNIFKKYNKTILLASSLNAISYFFYFAAYTYTSLTNSLIMLYTWPIFATLLSSLLLKEKVSGKNIFLLGLCFTGTILIYSNEALSLANKNIIGMSSMLISALAYSLAIVLYKKTSENFSQFELIFYQNLVGSIIFLPFLFINKPLPSLAQTSAAIFYAVVIGIVGYALFFSALKRIKASIASMLSYIEVISGVLFENRRFLTYTGK